MQTEPARKRVKVLLVEDHPMFRERLASVISKRGMLVCGQADNAREAGKLAETSRPDIAIVDLTLRESNGLDLLKDLKARGIHLPVLMLSMHDEGVYAERALRAGARGYITKIVAAAEVLEAVEQVLKGEIYLSRQMTTRMLGRVTAGEEASGDVGLLTDRELEVYRRIGQGQTAMEIAAGLGLGLPTINTYRARIKEKLGIRNGTELQHRATRWVHENPD
ncbi:MAG TPA: response regulator transcription factor [Chthoniobacteraceae bacterium]|jgi:DNA-binding NarL/FixJ family response regulator|nr:response regulator transcription factor [Chthoniobacteraceae bacterium]